MKTPKRYVVTGKRPNGEVLYLCCSATQGPRFNPLSQSRSVSFATRTQAATEASRMRSYFVGLEITVESIDERLLDSCD